MDTLNSLQAELSVLEVERNWIEKQGYLQGCWVAQYKPGGSARTEKVYWQIRSNAPMFGGKKAKHLQASEVAEYQAQIARGRRLKALDRQIATLQKRIDQVEQAAARLGVSLKGFSASEVKLK